MIYLAIICFGLLLYSYVGFPMLVSLLATLRQRRWTVDEKFEPTVSVILSAHNEALLIRRCLDSLLNLNYPKSKIEILCGSDGSTDLTNSILQEYTSRFDSVHIFLYSQQRGKMLTLNDLVPQANGEILLFVDADVALTPNSVMEYVRHYADSVVGGVAGRLAIDGSRADGVYRSESTFLSFESNIRRNEATVYSTVGLNGANYTMRRSLWKPLPDDRVHDDFFAVLSIINSGKRVLYEDNAIATEIYGRDLGDEFKRKSRSASRCFYTLSYLPRMLFKSPVAWMLWPHKVLRFLTSFLAAGVVIGSIGAYLQGSESLRPFIAIEALAGIIVVVGWIARLANKSIPLVSECYWFFQMNVAFLFGVCSFIFQTEKSTWTQTTQAPGTVASLVAEREAVHL